MLCTTILLAEDLFRHSPNFELYFPSNLQKGGHIIKVIIGKKKKHMIRGERYREAIIFTLNFKSKK